MSAIDVYKAFDTRQPGWLKVELDPAMAREQGELGKQRCFRPFWRSSPRGLLCAPACENDGQALAGSRCLPGFFF